MATISLVSGGRAKVVYSPLGDGLILVRREVVELNIVDRRQGLSWGYFRRQALGWRRCKLRRMLWSCGPLAGRLDAAARAGRVFPLLGFHYGVLFRASARWGE